MAQWTRTQLDRQNMSRLAASYNAGIGQATAIHILNREHIPTVETLCLTD